MPLPKVSDVIIYYATIPGKLPLILSNILPFIASRKVNKVNDKSLVVRIEQLVFYYSSLKTFI